MSYDGERNTSDLFQHTDANGIATLTLVGINDFYRPLMKDGTQVGTII